MTKMRQNFFKKKQAFLHGAVNLLNDAADNIMDKKKIL